MIRDFKPCIPSLSQPQPQVVPEVVPQQNVEKTQKDELSVAAQSRCLVYCRLRPSKSQDFEDGAFQLVTLHGKTVQLKDEKNYDFDGTFGSESQQEDIFSVVAVPCLEHAFKGYCSAMMCYGQTGTGKSFTMCCTKVGAEGIIPRAAKYIFDRTASDSARTYEVSGQFVQIYRDNLGDLMTESGREKVDIRFEKDEGVTLPGCTTHILQNAEHFMEFYNVGNARRVVTATQMNPESSRGHTALVVWITSFANSDPTAAKNKRQIDVHRSCGVRALLKNWHF